MRDSQPGVRRRSTADGLKKDFLTIVDASARARFRGVAAGAR